MEPNPKIRIPLTIGQQRQTVPLQAQPQRQPVPLTAQRSGGGTRDYNNLANKPKLNGVTVEGEHEGEYYGLADRAWVETYVTEQTARYTRFWFGTRAEYNALPEIDPAVCYCIEEGT